VNLTLKNIPCLFAVLALSIGPIRAEDTDHRPRVVLVSYEEEYHSAETLPGFARDLTDRFGCRCTMLTGEANVGIRGLDALTKADVLVLFARRHALPTAQMTAIRNYLDRGGALVGVRTASHAFDIQAAPPAGFEVWPAFDREVLGGNYHDHYPAIGRTDIVAAEKAAQHAILAGVDLNGWNSSASLYRTSPVAPSANVLLLGKHEKVSEPVAWTSSHHGGRVFYTSLGNKEDFRTPQFLTMLINATFWAMNKPVPNAR
jgi:type 1 glutamine amidotransferase